jgi:hypothetical protein
MEHLNGTLIFKNYLKKKYITFYLLPLEFLFKKLIFKIYKKFAAGFLFKNNIFIYI